MIVARQFYWWWRIRGSEKMFEKILVASDGSEHAIRAAEVAANLAKPFGAHVTVVNIATLPVPITPLVGVTGMDIDAVTVVEYNDRVQDAVARRTGKVFEDA